jgi:hypothetical protein
MAWTPITIGTNPSVNSTIWEFENTATGSDTYSDAKGTYSGGIRTFTFPNGNVQKTYVRCRKIGETIERGELSKDYYDAQV